MSFKPSVREVLDAVEAIGPDRYFELIFPADRSPDGDLFRVVAAQILGVSPKHVSEVERQATKSVMYSISYDYL